MIIHLRYYIHYILCAIIIIILFVSVIISQIFNNNMERIVNYCKLVGQ